MIKREFSFLFCFLFSLSVSYSSAPADLDFCSPKASLGELLERVRGCSPFSLPLITEGPSGEVDLQKIKTCYKRAKYGDKAALLDLESTMEGSPYTCVLVMKYYAGLQKGYFPPQYQSCLSIFFSLLGDKIPALTGFKVIEDPLFNVSMALYHQMLGKKALAESFAKAAADQSCVEGYNVMGRLYKKGKEATQSYLCSAQCGDPTGIYKLARLCPPSEKFLIEELCKHAAIRGNLKAHFALARLYERNRQWEQSIAHASHLIRTNPYVYVHIEQKKGLGRAAFYVAKELLRTNPSLFPVLLKSIYDHNPLKRKAVAQLLGTGYRFGVYGCPESVEDAYHWLRVSTVDHDNIEDGYQLCCMSASDSRAKKPKDGMLDIARRLVESSEILERYGTVPQILLARLLIEEAEKQGNSAFFEEAAYWLLNSFGRFEEDSPRRRRMTWQIPGTSDRGVFPVLETAQLRAIEKETRFSQRQQGLYELGFHHLSGGSEGCISLSKAQQYFFQAGELSSESSYFYVTVIGHYLSLQRLIHALEDKSEKLVYRKQEEVKRKEAIATYQKVSDLLDKHRDLDEEERVLLKKKVRELSFTNLEEAALSLAAWFHFGMHGLSSSVEHEIYWLKFAASKGDDTAQRLLKSRYPLVLPLGDEEEAILHHSRTHKEGNPDLVIVGGGISGVMTALSFAKAIREGKLRMGKITLVEQKEHLFTGASGMVSRQHRGGEYPKDPVTARQCLYGTAIWGQMYSTERMLTEKRTNDFLLARASHELVGGEAALTKEQLVAHHIFLDGLYKRYLEQFEASGKDGEKLLFGPSPIFQELKEEDLISLGSSPHFIAGVSTGERGFNPIAIGALLEHLLCRYNIEVITGYEVTDINSSPKGGFRIEGRGQRPIYAKYLINAAWHNNSRLGWLLKSSVPSSALTLSDSQASSSAKRVFLRCLALVDISECTLPEDSSFFGLVGEHGGMVSCFNDWVASIFIPKDGISYHGEYNLDESAVNILPRAAREKLDTLRRNEVIVATRIIEDAKTKYPFLDKAKAKGLSIQTTVSENFDEVFKRTHIDAKWVEKSRVGCLEICATKATFGPFQALQALARFAADKPDGLEVDFTPEEMRFLGDLIHPDMFKEGTIENVLLPESFKIILDDSFMTEAQFLAAMRRYAFGRGIDFALFEKTRETAAVGMNPAQQLGLVSEEEGMTSLDLENHIINESIAIFLFPLLGKRDIDNVKLGPLDEERNNDEEDEFGATILARLQENDCLKNLTLKDWNLTFSSRYRPLGTLSKRLEEIHLKGITLTLQSVRAVFGGESSFLGSLKKLSVVDSNLKKPVLRELMKGIQKWRSLECLDLSGNEIGKETPDEISRDLGCLVIGSPSLRCLFLHNNRLFEGVNLNPSNPFSLPLDLEANPFLLAVTSHLLLEQALVIDNGATSRLVQDRLDSYFYKKKAFK